MHRGPVVPDHDFSKLPFVRVEEPFLRTMLMQLLEYLSALYIANTFDP